MIKKIINLICIASMALLSSCKPGLKQTIFDDSATQANKRFEQIVEVINNRDKKALTSIFSEKALSEAEDFEGGVDYLFNLVDGDIGSWEYVSRGNVSDSINHGARQKIGSSWYYANTENQKYLIFFLEYLIDTAEPENIGVYMLQVIKAEDKETQFDSGGPNTTRCAGIYRPKEGDNT